MISGPFFARARDRTYLGRSRAAGLFVVIGRVPSSFDDLWLFFGVLFMKGNFIGSDLRGFWAEDAQPLASLSQPWEALTSFDEPQLIKVCESVPSLTKACQGLRILGSKSLRSNPIKKCLS